MHEFHDTPVHQLANSLRATSLEPVRATHLPPVVADHFREQSSKSVGRATDPERFFELLAMHTGPVTSYLGHHMKHHHEGLVEEDVYVADTSTRGDMIGFGTVHMQHNPLIPERANLPYVGYTLTSHDQSADYRGKRLGTRRLILMDVASRLLLHGPVHSGERPTPPALRIWQRLEAAGLAGSVTVGSHKRFRFL